MVVKNKIKETKEPAVDNPVVLTRWQKIWLRIKKTCKLLLWVALLLVLIVGGFFLGVYLRVFDTNTINEKLELYKYPVLNEYFVKPDKSINPETNKDNELVSKNKLPDNSAKPLEGKPADLSKPVILTKEEIAKQTKLRQAEEKKRIGKLARLYNEMKPADAAAILDELNDDMIVAILGKMDEGQVAKILVEFNADKSARLTRNIYNGKPVVLNTSIDTANNANNVQEVSH